MEWWPTVTAMCNLHCRRHVLPMDQWLFYFRWPVSLSAHFLPQWSSVLLLISLCGFSLLLWFHSPILTFIYLKTGLCLICTFFALNSCPQPDLDSEKPLRLQVKFLDGVTLASVLDGIPGPDWENVEGKRITPFSVTTVEFTLGDTLNLHCSTGISRWTWIQASCAQSSFSDE